MQRDINLEDSPLPGGRIPLEEVLVEPTSSRHSSEEDILSILNVVVDYVMVPPTPLEPDEFSWQLQSNLPKNKGEESDPESDYHEDIQVPVLRLFGPITRPSNFAFHSQSSSMHDTADINNEANQVNLDTIMNRQSGCLYIHGAYPYLLARPVTAGIDGSPFTYNKESKVDGEFNSSINWDDPESVDTITMELHSTLEGALKTYFDAESLRTLGQKNQVSSRTAGHSTSMTDATTPTKPSIRYIRSITIVMGRGFYSFSLGPPAPFLRVEYYNPKMRWIVKALLEQGLDVPRPLHPDPCQYEQVDSQKIDGRLIFHCFEAHIPYTMQVFKDLNLSGMSPVLVRDCRFRTPLPRKRRIRVVTSSREDDILNNQSASSSNHLFLKGNVKDSFIWQSVCNRESFSNGIDMDEFWTRKETSCDIEADTTVKNISNVQYILRPDDDDANDDTIHWRAVPSLREIWEEEKRRMEYLCSRTKEDCKDVFQFDAPTTKSGTRLAATGARRLFDSTPEIRGHYIKALTDIVLFHEKEVAEEDQRFQSIATKSDLKTENSIVCAIDRDEDVLNTLRALAAQFSPAAGSESHSDIDHLLSRCLSSQERSTPMISSRKKSDKSSLDLHKLANDIEFGMNVDRCDVVEDFLSQGPPSNDVVLNPLTLTMERMNDDDDEESFEDEEDFERSLSATDKDLHPTTNHDSDFRHFHQSIFLELDEDKNMKNTTPSAFARTHRLPFPLEQSDYSPSFKKPSSTKEVDHSFLTGLFYEQCTKAPNRSEVLKSLPGFSTSFTNYTAFQFSNDVINKMGWDSSFLTGDNYQTLSYYEPTTGPPSSISVRRYQLQNPLYSKKKELSSKHISKTSEVTVQNSQEKDENTCSYVAIEEVADADESCHILADDHTIGSPSLNQIQADGQAKSTRYYRKKNITMTKLSNSSAQCPKSGDVPSSHGTGFDLKATSSSKALMSGGLSLMSIEIHVQCRTGKSSLNKTKEIAMTPDPAQDPIFAIAYIYSLDPGNGERIQVLDQGCVFIPITRQVDSSQVPLCHQPDGVKEKNLRETLGISSTLNLEVATDERHLLLRFSSIIQLKDPDVLISWDTQCAGIGYILSRGEELRKMDIANNQSQLDMIRLLGRTPRSRHSCDCNMNDFAAEESEKNKITGSGLGTEWDDLVGAGGLASSIIGRISLCGWKIISEEVQHPNASYQPAMVSNILKKKMPFHDDLILTLWYAKDSGNQRHRVLQYRIIQCHATIMLFDALDVFGRAGEAARLSGVELSQSFPGIRGSQYKVEGVLLRALKSISNSERGSKHGRRNINHSSSDNNSARSKSQSQSPWKIRRVISTTKRGYLHDDLQTDSSYFFFSPSRDDCKLQEALECQAMTLEPKSGFHFDPIVVVDFQSLYPSLIIAYNLCYSTLAGKLDYHSTRPEMRVRGRSTNRLGPFKYSERRSATVLTHHMKSLRNTSSGDDGSDRAYVFPTGSIFVSENVLKGVLPQVLDEMLATRSMLKKVAKDYRRRFHEVSPAVLRQLEARQLALKYVANVTYGYTSATFSGRCAMPILADTIVECGRRTLTNAINLANKWGQDRDHIWKGCEVVYGDTDSIFLKLPGRSIKEAFAFGEDFCKAVTNANPPPIQLKLEKVYAFSLLQTKKKYCGLKFESPDQQKPVFEAKGMETVRRDQCKLTQNVLRNALMTLFCGGSIVDVRMQLCRQWALIHAGRLPVSEFILTGRVRSEYRGGKIGPVQSALARRLAESDPARRILHKERLPYVIAALPGHTFKLRDCVLTPNELLEHWDAFTIHCGYYITKHVNAALKRCFSLAPYYCDIDSWYEASPKVPKPIHYWPSSKSGHGSMISFFFGSDACAICRRPCHSSAIERVVVCDACKDFRSNSTYIAILQLNSIQQQSNQLAYICHECNGCLENSGSYAREKLVPISKATGARNKPTTKFMVDGIHSPISNCTCVDCEISYKRHELREREIETLALCKALQLDTRLVSK